MATAAVFHPTPKQSFFGWVPRKETHAVVRLTAPVRAPAAYTDFSSSFLSANLLGSPSRRRTVTVSIVTHTFLVAVPLLLSLWFTNTLDLRTYTQTLLVAPPAAAAPSPPPKVVAAQPVHPSRRVFTSQGRLILPTAIPKQIAMLKEEPLPPEENGGVFGGIPGGVTGGVLGGILEGLKAPEAPAVPRPAESPRVPVPVGGNVQPPRIIFQVTPEYPVLAKQAGIQGEVIISAVIDSTGKVVDMKVVSGPPLLFASAMKALAQWKFEPTYLNGEPMAIRWNASVKFRIGGARQVS